MSFGVFVSTETYNVDRSGLSVSGVSSGAIMASQLHVIYSSKIMGVGLVAGGRFESLNDLYLFDFKDISFIYKLRYADYLKQITT